MTPSRRGRAERLPWRARSAHTGRGSALAALTRFLADTRAGATALVGAAIAMMVLGGAGLLIDHLWLVSKRDILKSAADAAAVAATLELRRLPRSTSDDAIRVSLQQTAERYARLNVMANVRTSALEAEDIGVHLTIDRAAGLVGTRVEADIGAVLVGWLQEYSGPETMAQLGGVEHAQQSLSVVLAIDESNSMRRRLDGGTAHAGERSRMAIVRSAAIEMVQVIRPNAAIPVKVGLVPWSIELGAVLAPSTNQGDVLRAIRALRGRGGATISTLGLSKGRELLSPEPEDVNRALVLLTDGEDNMDADGQICLRSTRNCEHARRLECTTAKDAGIEIFVIAAMTPAKISTGLGQELQRCATSERHVFTENFTPQDLEEAFTDIAGQLGGLRKVR